MLLFDGLEKSHFYVKAVRPPTVPEGTARLRFSITRYHEEEDLKKCAAVLAEALDKTAE
jgi:8-amino-7-oxononanoate synthase